jgi:hypothetical protein
MFAQFDTVVLTENILEKKLTKGMIGAIIEVYKTPDSAYEVEFCDLNGRTIAVVALLPSQIKIASKIEIDDYFSSLKAFQPNSSL